ncbi:MAG: hypothetical protein ACLRZG_11415 [Streptococcus sp.]
MFTQSGSQGINFTGLVLHSVLYAGALPYMVLVDESMQRSYDETETEKEE